MASDLNDLYQQYRAGNESLEDELLTALLARFRLFVRRRIKDTDDAEDVVQVALVAICAELKNLEITTSFAAWAYKVLNNRIMAYLKDKSRIEKRSVSMSEQGVADNVHSPAYDPDYKRILLNCLGKIGQANIRFARGLNLKSQGYTVEEICKRLSVTPTNFYTIIKRARKMLELCIEKGGVV
jgi:RNA polymerase sigma factor (sigma-70 family)